MCYYQTVIESLKYIATGDMPPGTKNSSFVHDPKVLYIWVLLPYIDYTGTVLYVPLFREYKSDHIV